MFVGTTSERRQLLKMSRTTNQQQYQKLLELLSSRQDVAQGFTQGDKFEVEEFWQEVATELNDLGPPSKNWTAWRKTWLDWKCYVKKKLVFNKRLSRATGVEKLRKQPINTLEEEVIRLTGLGTCRQLSNGSVLPLKTPVKRDRMQNCDVGQTELTSMIGEHDELLSKKVATENTANKWKQCYGEFVGQELASLSEADAKRLRSLINKVIDNFIPQSMILSESTRSIESISESSDADLRVKHELDDDEFEFEDVP